MGDSIFQVNLEGVLKVLSDSLYSRKEVFIRELIQNSVDAIKARQSFESFEPQILIEFYTDQEEKGIIFTDNGIGLTNAEVEEFLSKIGSSSKSKELLLNQRNDFIGQFGIGLLSCFMVSDEITVLSKSIKSNEVVKWTGNINGTYKTESIEIPFDFGTKVILKLRKDIELDKENFLALLSEYGRFVGLPINAEINGNIQVNFQEKFPWENLNNDAILQLGEEFFLEDFQHYIILESENKKTKGIAYIFPRPIHYALNQSHRVYIKNMFITDKSTTILPEWAFFVKCIINSEELAPTASREEIYSNKDLEKVQNELGKIIKKYLKNLSITAPKILEKIIQIHGNAMKSLALSDEEFLKFIYKWFKFQTNFGVLNLEDIKKNHKTILYVTNIDEYRQIIPIATANNTLIVNAAYIFEADLFEAIETIDKKNIYQRINAEYFGNILTDLSVSEFNALEERIEEFQKYLTPFKCSLEIKKFNPNSIPAMFYMSEEIIFERDVDEIKEESDELWNFLSDAVFDESEDLNSKLFINFDNMVILKLIHNTKPELDQMIIETLYINALMTGHYPLSTLELQTMNKNMILMLDKLA